MKNTFECSVFFDILWQKNTKLPKRLKMPSQKEKKKEKKKEKQNELNCVFNHKQMRTTPISCELISFAHVL